MYGPCRAPASRASRLCAISWSRCFVALALVLTAGLLALAAPARAADDTTPPEVTAFSITPAEFNTESADQALTVTMTLTDDLSGVATLSDAGAGSFCGVSLVPLVGWQQVYNSGTDGLHRISGDDHNGVYTTTLTVPRGSKAGEWHVSLGLDDKVGNQVGLSAADLAAKFGPGCGTVTNTATVSDSAPPEITAFSITPTEFNTESADQTLTVTMTITDAQAGVDLCSVQFTPVNVAQYHPPQAVWSACTRVSGDDHSGVYAATITVPRWSQEGAWQVHNLGVRDKVGNAALLVAADLAAKFGPGCGTVTNAATVSDSTPPEITAFSITPTEFNTESADQTLTVTMTITDAQSGVSTQDDDGSVYACYLRLTPLISTQSVSGGPTRISGDDHNGVYSMTVTVPKWGKEGVWRLDYLDLADKVGNLVKLDSDALNALLPGADSLVVNTATAQQVTIDRDWTITNAHTDVTFPAGTVVTRADAGRFAFYEMTAQEFTLDDSVPTTDLDGTPLATLQFGIPGHNLSFSQPVTVSMEVGPAYERYRLSIQSLTEGSEAWANEATCTVLNGRVTFTVNHATKFVANLTKSSLPKATITKLSPTKARRGATVTITGKNFGKKRGRSVVKFGTRTCVKYVSWSATRIKCRIPARAKPGRLQVRVTTSAGTSRGRAFTVKR